MRATGRTSHSFGPKWLITAAFLSLVLAGCARRAQAPRPPEQATQPVGQEARQGLILEPRQFALTDGRVVYEAPAAKQKLAHPLVSERVVPAGRKGRFEIAIEAPKDAQGLRLRYSGFTKIEEVPLP